ncbi:hypothetical protein Prudu_000806 [Prunus dulcis]|uniref:Uncharacterized protein n=1 Tax=Prunus dulcis TaxID=3755 RepID=A0A4Y1QM48_PRUDU|nr:hypothetical protein Prudu_000806 [Prunus dulcis]
MQAKTKTRERIMVKKMSQEVQKKRPIKRNKKKLLKKVIDFLISNSYMFAPLISHPPHGFSSPMKTRASITGRKPIKGDNKRLLKKVGDYLKSDSYMYVPCLLHLHQPVLVALLKYLKKVVTMANSERKLFLKYNKSNERFTNVIAEDQASKGCLPEKVLSEQQSVVHKETVKHVVHHSCRSSMSLIKLGHVQHGAPQMEVAVAASNSTSVLSWLNMQTMKSIKNAELSQLI